jgi:outer membrane protein assembly factor BamB
LPLLVFAIAQATAAAPKKPKPKTDQAKTEASKSGPKKEAEPAASGSAEQADERNRLGFPLEKAWEARLPARIEGGPLPAGRRILVLTAEGDLLAYDALKGEQQWKFHVDFTPFGEPVQADKLVVVAGRGGKVLGLNPTGPDIAWQVSTPSPITAPLAVAGDLVLVGMDSGVLLALSAGAGEEQWRFAAAGPLLAAPGADGEFLYLADGQGVVHKLSRAEGRELWSTRIGGVVSAAPLAVDGRLFLGSSDNRAYGIDQSDGDIEWKIRLGADLNAPPVAFGDAVLFACLDGRLYFLRQKDGRQINAPFLYFRLTYAPLVANSIVFITPLADQLAGVDPATGSVAGTFSLGALAATPLAYARDMLFLGLGDRRLLAVKRVSAGRRKLLEASQAVQTQLIGKLPLASSADEERYDGVLRSFDQALRDSKVESSFAGHFLDQLKKLEPDKGFSGHEDELLALLGEVEKQVAGQQQQIWQDMADETLQKAVVPILPADLPDQERKQVLDAFRRLLLATYSRQLDTDTSSQFMQTYTPLLNDGDVTADDLKVLSQAIDRMLKEHPPKDAAAGSTQTQSQPTSETPRQTERPPQSQTQPQKP